MYSLGVKRNEMYTLRVKRYAQTLPRIWIVKFIPRFIPVFLKRAKRYDKDTLRVERYVFKLRDRIRTSTQTSRAKISLSLLIIIYLIIMMAAFQYYNLYYVVIYRSSKLIMQEIMDFNGCQPLDSVYMNRRITTT